MVRSRINPRDVAERYCVAFCRFGGSLLSTKRARDDARRCTCSNVDSTASPRAEYCWKRKNIFISRLRRCTLSMHEFKPLEYRGRVVIIGPNKHTRRIVLSWKISQCRNTTFEVCLGKLGSRTGICLEKVLLTNKVMVKHIFPIGSSENRPNNMVADVLLSEGNSNSNSISDDFDYRARQSFQWHGSIALDPWYIQMVRRSNCFLTFAS